jgi:broad specificity phosphatase PhoE
MRTLSLSGILSSDLPRALQTAEAVAAACGLPVETSPLLQERNFGDLRGRAYDTLGFDPLAQADAPPGGESVADFEARVLQGWAWILGRRAALGGPMAVVSHGLVLRVWLQPGRVDAQGHDLPAHLANTALSSLDAEPPHRVHVLACSKHLDGLEGHDTRSLVGG